MPKLLRKLPSTAYVTNDTIQATGNALCYTKSLDFLGNLANKLSELTNSLKTQFDTLRNQIPSTTGGTILASVTIRSPPIGIRYEYFEYITRYGPPVDGIFNPDYLTVIRRELGIVNI
jgi:hypothetical protein